MTIRGMLREVYWHSGGDPDAQVVADLAALCPACGFEHSFRVDLDGNGTWARQSGKNGVWTFNNDYEKPTFSPSMLANKDRIYEHHPICHSFLKEGVWQFLGDCTHAMAGQHVPMIPPVEGMSFQRRHGWHLFPWTDDDGQPLKELA